MKRLMLLGGNRYQLPVIKTAHELGYYVITCDYLPDNIAHKYSDYYCNVSIVNKEDVLEAARELKIDGIMSFGCDPGVTTAAYVAEKMGLPSVGSYEAVSILQNKGRFRQFLKEHGFNVPTARRYKNPEDCRKDLDLFHWPVMVKPTDSAGSKGVSRVDNPAGLPQAIDYAIQNSISKEYIIEDYLEKVGCSSDTDCFSINGELDFINFNAQYFDEKAENPYTPAGFSWPSTLSDEHEAELASELKRLVKLLGLKTSIYNIETRECTDGKAYIMEVSPRGGGNRLAEMVRFITGVDLIRAAVLAAVGEGLPKLEAASAKGHWAQVILHADTTGSFEDLWISENIQKFVVERDLWVEKGDHVEAFTGANHSIGTLVFCFDDRELMLKVIQNVREFVQIIVK